MKRVDKFIFFFSTFLFIVSAINSQAAGDPQLYTNEDLAPYENQYQSEKGFTEQSKKEGKHRKASGRVRHVDQQGIGFGQQFIAFCVIDPRPSLGGLSPRFAGLANNP